MFSFDLAIFFILCDEGGRLELAHCLLQQGVLVFCSRSALLPALGLRLRQLEFFFEVFIVLLKRLILLT